VASLNDLFTQGQNAFNQGQGIYNTLTTDPTKLVTRVIVNTAYLPQMTVQPGGPSSGQGRTIADHVLAVLKPEVIVQLDHGLPPLRVAPHGSPGATRWPVVRWAAIAGGLFVGWTLLKGLVR
jgi:hypothetical protein